MATKFALLSDAHKCRYSDVLRCTLMSSSVLRCTHMYSDVLIYPLCPLMSSVNYRFKVNTYGLGTTALLLWRFLWGGNGYSLTSGGCGLSLVVDGLEPTFYSENFCPTTPSLCSGRLCISHQVLMAMFAKVRWNFCSLQNSHSRR